MFQKIITNREIVLDIILRMSHGSLLAQEFPSNVVKAKIQTEKNSD
jgi:hypothetical protein